jgi:VWFA-related protein
MKALSLYAATFVVAAFTSVQAQQPAPSPTPPPQDEVIRVTTNLVQADVIVTDKSGRQVTDLRPEDFEVLEDGKRQTLSHFSYISTDRPNQQIAKSTDSSSGVLPLPVSEAQARRTLAIVVDDLGLSAESIVSVRKALNEFVENQMQPTDLVAIVRTTQASGALQQFTSDKSKLLAMIERINWFGAGRGALSAFAPVNTQQEVTSVQGAQILSEVEEERASNYAVGTIGTLSLVVRGLRDVTGRKAVLLISESFRLFTTQGRNIRLLESLKQVADQANRSSTIIYTLDASGLNPLNLTAEDKVSGPAYTFDPNSFQNPGSPPTPPLRNRGTPRRNDVAPNAASIALEEGGSSAAFKRLDALVSQRDNQNIQNHTVLSFLADQTGGLFTANTNNLSLATERMLQDQSGYYLLAYRPSEPSTGSPRFHKLTFKVKRSGVNVRSREGYYTGTSEIASAKTREARLSQALISPFAAGAVAVRITPLFFNDRAEGSYLRVLLHLEAKDLTFNEQSNKSQQTVLDIVAVNLGEDGKVVDHFSDTQTLDVKEEAFSGVQKNGLSFVLNVPVKKSGAYQLRVAVRDVASDRIGSAGQFVQVPDVAKNHLSLSGVVISGLNQGTSADATLQAVPSLRRLTHGMVLSYSYTIYNAEVKEDRPQLETQMLLFREGKQVFAGKLSPFDPGTQSDMKRLKVAGGLRLGPELPAGGYVLQVMVTDKLRNKPNTAVQTLDFVIVE